LVDSAYIVLSMVEQGLDGIEVAYSTTFLLKMEYDAYWVHDYTVVLVSVFSNLAILLFHELHPRQLVVQKKINLHQAMDYAQKTQNQ